MTLHLSRLFLNPFYGRSLELAADPYLLHQKLLPTLPCRPREKPRTGEQPKTADLLFRVDETDGGPVVLMQTTEVPDWSCLELAPRALRRPPETKPYSPNFTRGQQLNFRLLCRPMARCSRPFLAGKREVKRGQRYSIRGEDELIAWLKAQGSGYSERPGLNGFGGRGFVVESAGITWVRWFNSKGRRGGERPWTREALGAVRFDGTLVVSDPEKFGEAIRRGIGPQKAFGFGLLSVAPVR